MPPDRPQEFALLQSVSRISCLANELRLKILGTLANGPRTASQVAAELGEPATLIHYHMKRLLDADLVREVAVAAESKGRASERYYLALARHLFVDPGIACTDPATVKTLVGSMEQAMDAWQREKVFGVDLQALAQRIIGDCLQTAPGDRILIIAQPQVREIVERLFLEAEARGGRPIMRPWSREYALARLDRMPRERLEQDPFSPFDQLEQLDAVVLVSSTQPSAVEPTAEQRQKLPLLLQGLTRWQRELRRRGVRHVELSIPASGDLGSGTLSPVDAMALYWRTFDATPEELLQAGESWQKRVLAAQDGQGVTWLEVRDDEGNRLHFPALAAKPHWNTGRLTREDASAGRTMEEFPAGSIAWLPAPGAACHGRLRAPRLAIHGTLWHELLLNSKTASSCACPARATKTSKSAWGKPAATCAAPPNCASA
ncbi:MAG: helix-turn-helix domain-containing protein [Planctomycetota bacterium]